jgi:hypothetical protein
MGPAIWLQGRKSAGGGRRVAVGEGAPRVGRTVVGVGRWGVAGVAVGAGVSVGSPGWARLKVSGTRRRSRSRPWFQRT